MPLRARQFPSLSRVSRRVFAVAFSLALAFCSPLLAQQASDSQLTTGAAPAPKSPKAPALVDPAGPNISLQNSEAVFDIAAALNVCGYDDGLAASSPVRTQVRDLIQQAVQGSEQALDARDRLCTFVEQHKLSDSGLDLAQYISLALYITPPPTLTPSVAESDMPPDSTQVEDILPLVRSFDSAVDMHLIWLQTRPACDKDLAILHTSLTRMIVETNAYLKMPANTYSGERFLVVVEPLLDPGQINARVYGSDYVVVASPSNGAIRMNEVRHTYLHYEIEPLLYARAAAMDRLLPFLKIVRDAPLDYTDRSDIVPLVIECMIRAIEARTMDTGVAIYKVPPDTPRSGLEAATQKHNATLAKVAAIRQSAVDRSMSEGFILTQYFYDQFRRFEKQPQSFSESIGEMVYGMDVQAVFNSVKHMQFANVISTDVVQRAPQQLQGLDLAEADLIKGDSSAAGALAQRALADRAGDPARANFILARVSILHGDISGAKQDFEQTVQLSKNPRQLAWAHIYLGRIEDVEGHRDQALVQYQAALTLRDGQQDTKFAAERGLKQPYAVPEQVHTAAADGDDSDSTAQDDPGPPSSAGSQAPAADKTQ